jgi:hypothetical protein
MKTFQATAIFFLSLALTVVPALLTAQDETAPPPPAEQGAPDQDAPDNSPPTQAEQTPEQLQQLVAPIALYPDPLVAQILNASTYPTQVVAAERWLQQNPGLSGEQLAQAVDSQSWDPSVKALMQYPSVLENMDKNLSWTSSLGDAYYNQPEDVMNAIQVMRQQAQEAGNLKNSPQEVVSGEPGSIVIQPANPNVVYVPIYDPWYAYGPPIAVWPGFVYTTWWVPRPFFGFSIGFPIGFWGHYGWGWPGWRFDWRARNVWFHGAPYVSHSPAFFDRRGYYAARPGFRGSPGPQPGFRRGPAPTPERGFRPGPAPGPRPGFRPGPMPETQSAPHVGRGFGTPQGQQGVRSGAFTGVQQHGGETRTFSSRGQASVGGGARGGGGRR